MGRVGVMLTALALAGAAHAEEKPVVCFGCNAVDGRSCGRPTGARSGRRRTARASVDVLGLDIELRDHPRTIQGLTSSRAVIVTAAASYDSVLDEILG